MIEHDSDLLLCIDSFNSFATEVGRSFCSAVFETLMLFLFSGDFLKKKYKA